MKSFSFTYTPYYWLTVSSLAVLLFFAGLFVSSFWFSERWEEMFKGNIEFLAECEPDLKEQQLIELENKLSKLEGVRDLRFVSAQDAMKVMKEELGDIALPDSMENPFRASFRFKLDAAQVDTGYVKSLQQQITSIDGITAFYYPEDLYSEVRGRLKSISLMT
ncbi:MAG: permease-like cell division protein FtsX, partial [Bacteroidota bacterium]|nr:permease-like cell division protein FtsX [Bacteroidota bacterium]